MDPDSAETEESDPTFLFCRLCQSVYNEPKLLPCLHSFCGSCLAGAVTSCSEGPCIVCPVCAHKVLLPASGVDEVPDNCFLNRMCQEYVNEVQTNIAARSAIAGASPRLPALSSRDSSKTATDEQTPHIFSVDRDPSSALSADAALEAIRNMSRLQRKVMSLQGEALRVTYAIDQVNQSMIEWHQHKEDLKRAVQRRSEQFQFFIKRMEHQLITKIDGKQADDSVYLGSDKSKDELRKMLKNILHEVSVLKNIQELGNDAEINALSANLLGRSVSMADVTLNKYLFDMSFPTKTIEEVVSMYFGDVELQSEENKVFVPQILDFTDVPVGTTAEPQVGRESFGYEDRIGIPIVEDKELENAAISKRRQMDRRSRKYNTDLGLEKPDVKEYLAQFQSARETFRTRRKEILAQGQKAREDASPLREELYRRPRSTSRKGRDRATAPVTLRAGSVPPGGLQVQGIKTTGTAQTKHFPFDHSIQPSAPTHSPTSMHQFRDGSGTSCSASAEKPALSGVSGAISQIQRQLVKQSSDPRYSEDVPLSPKESPYSNESSPSNSKTLMEQLRNRRLSSPISGVSMERRHSDQFSSLSSMEHISSDLLKHDRATSRPARRAISSAADRRTKMEFLRENWQKRKEILIQSEGFVCPDHAAKHEPAARPISLATASGTNTDSFDTAHQPVLSPTRPDDPRLESMHQIKSRVAQYRNELTKLDQARRKEEMVTPASLTSAKVPEKPYSDLQEQKDIFNADVVLTGTASGPLSPATEQITSRELKPTSSLYQQTAPEKAAAEAGPATSAIHWRYSGYHEHMEPKPTERVQTVLATASSPETCTVQGLSVGYDQQEGEAKEPAEIIVSAISSETSKIQESDSGFDHYPGLKETDREDVSSPATKEVPEKSSEYDQKAGLQETDQAVVSPTASTVQESYSGYGHHPGLTETDQATVTSTVVRDVRRSYSQRDKEEAPKETVQAVASPKTRDASGSYAQHDQEAALKEIDHATVASPITSTIIGRYSQYDQKARQIEPVPTATIASTETTTSHGRYSRYDQYKQQTAAAETARLARNKTTSNEATIDLKNSSRATGSIQTTTTAARTETSTSQGRYSRIHTQPRETIDVASLIAAMYSGNEKSLLRSSKPDSEASTSQTTQPVTSTASITTATTTTSITATISTSTSTSAAISTSTTNNSIITAPSPTNSITTASKNSSRFTTNSTTITTTIITSTSRPASAVATTAPTTPENLATTTVPKPPENLATTTVPTTLENLATTTSTTTVPADLTTIQTPPHTNPTDNQTPSDSTSQTLHKNPSAPNETSPTPERRKYRYAASSRYSDGISRRHTIQVEKSTVENALKLISNKPPPTSEDISFKPTPESPTLNQSLQIQHRNLPSDPPRKFDFSEIMDPSLTELLESDEAAEKMIEHEMKYPLRMITKPPSPLEMIQEKFQHQYSPTAAAAASGIPSPTSRNETDSQKLRLREIARKKKERWRHVTIH